MRVKLSSSMAPWAVYHIAALMLLQEYSPSTSHTVQAAAIAGHEEARQVLMPPHDAVQEPSSSIDKDIPQLQPRNRRRILRKRQGPSRDSASPDTILYSEELLVDVLAPAVPTASPPTSSLPWCTDLSSATTSITSSSALTSSTPASSTTSSSSSINTATLSNLITSSSAGEAICIALPTPFSSSSSSSSSLSSPSSSSSALAGVQTIVVAPSNASPSSSSAGRARSTRTVTATAVQTVPRQQQQQISSSTSPNLAVTTVGVTSTVFVYSTTTHLDTVYTTITPRPTAAFITS
ncbi:hypothetical protein P389DRAFT_210155 [Cystobasidium minutum MCA 4210]|uniref:uncharacterized protein n=1 Tax=Cystobasidium minutum MCA 4210 TaxID=1397322 RepID=UPI0034CD8002|eukprot:jgi/Rhomi1/210155/estExt_Genemark1.C_3_t20373